MTDDILSRYPAVAGRPLAMALMCTPLIDRGRKADAYALGQAALAAAPDDIQVGTLVRKALSTTVPAFHLGMLRDGPRNACYATAITRAVRPGMRVLDIGTGAGLLALLAARAGAQVVTCESNSMIAAAAQAVVARNGLADRIRVIPKRSSDLRIGEDLDAPCDLLVSELFGDDLVEEGVVAAIGDARARLLHPDAPIVPPRAELRCALVTDDRPQAQPLDTVLGFDLAPFAALTKQRRYVPHRPSPHVTIASAPVSALAIDFAAATPPPTDDRIVLTSHGGRIDGVAHWLRIDFGDGTVYENAPFDCPDAHWLVPIHPFPQPRETRSGDTVAVGVRTFGPRLVVGPAD